MVQILITLSDEGQFRVEGPLENTLQMHGMLGMAANVVNEFNAKRIAAQEQPRVELASPGIIRFKA